MSTNTRTRRHTAPFDLAQLDWVPLREGLSFKPITFYPDGSGWQLLLRLEPGTVIPPHRHTGEVHGFNLSGSRFLINTKETVGPGTYVYEPPGNADTWKQIGDEPCIVHIEVKGRIEYLDDRGTIVRTVDAKSSQKTYLDWCAETGKTPIPALALPFEA
ncbi:2,4'-dihydroxyacetophenone dioxygenase family protein [Pendulispora albinea]|uniref:2,4'-dihydroxyacetophenone dioxygenase family protein n=1 Tax=Pendulispora albinea TaxID=2741071 RepID=A0ABZ2M0W5_9BACT